MAKKRRKTKKQSSGSTLMGIMVGLILGLAAAVAVALFVTQVPMPFVDKASRDPAQTLLPDVRNAPDPNLSLSSPSDTTVDNLNQTAPGEGPPALSPDAVRSGDSLGNFIASLATSPKQPEVDTQTPPTLQPKPATKSQSTYYLQAGAFRSNSDAESIKARVLMLGLPVHVEQAKVDGDTINRVRVGPFNGIDQMNQARGKLGAEKIESAVVRQ